MNGDSVTPDDTRHVENESVKSHTEPGQEATTTAAVEHPAEEPEHHHAEVQPEPEPEAEAQGILMISLKPGGQDVVPSTQDQQDQPDHQDQPAHHNHCHDVQDHHNEVDERQQEVQHDSQQDQYDPSAPDIRRLPMDPFLQQNIKVEEEAVYGVNSQQAMNRTAHHMNRPVDHFRLYERPSDPFQGMPFGDGDTEGSHSMSQGMYPGDNGGDYDMEGNQEQQGKDPFDGIKSGFDLFRGKGVGYQSRGYSGDHSQNRPRENKQDQFKPQDQQFKSFNDNKSQGFHSRSSQDGSEIGVPLGKKKYPAFFFLDQRLVIIRSAIHLYLYLRTRWIGSKGRKDMGMN